IFWPDREYQANMEILVAGCGTNQAAVIAYTNPTAHVVAVDVSAHSLDHHRHLAGRYGLVNLELHRLPIEEITSLEQEFDLIISTGVLHHLADPDAGLRSLAKCLRPNGVLALMLYASYGRLGVEIMQSIFGDLGLGRNEPSLAMIRDAVRQVNPEHPLVGYLRIANDMTDDAGLVDTFVHARERSYTIDECREFVESAGLIFQDLFLKSPYYPPAGSGSDFLAWISTMPRELQWSVMERLNTLNACHFFMACRSDRPRQDYAIDLGSQHAVDYVPALRHGCRLEGDLLVKAGGRIQLQLWQREVLQQVDGVRSIGAITTGLPEELAARKWFTELWQQDYLAMGLPSAKGTNLH
ncbi:MAG: class I SAM-dependent methyltransferase, partial [Actinomycetales bacterium]